MGDVRHGGPSHWQRGGGAGRALGVDIGGHHGGAGRAEPHGDRATDAIGRSRDDGDPTGERRRGHRLALPGHGTAAPGPLGPGGRSPAAAASPGTAHPGRSTSGPRASASDARSVGADAHGADLHEVVGDDRTPLPCASRDQERRRQLARLADARPRHGPLRAPRSTGHRMARSGSLTRRNVVVRSTSTERTTRGAARSPGDGLHDLRHATDVAGRSPDLGKAMAAAGRLVGPCTLTSVALDLHRSCWHRDTPAVGADSPARWRRPARHEAVPDGRAERGAMPAPCLALAGLRRGR
jgi:hypothetical protein